jgi:hypothetical protein
MHAYKRATPDGSYRKTDALLRPAPRKSECVDQVLRTHTLFTKPIDFGALRGEIDTRIERAA